MPGFSTGTNDHLIRSNLWSADLKKILEDELFATRYVDWLSGFPDGDTFNIPSIGQAEAQDYQEGESVKYTAMDTGNFTFSINNYQSSATYITNKMKQDSYYMGKLVSSFVPKQSRALMKNMETKILALGNDSQTATSLNEINGAAHRWVAGGTDQVMTVKDFAKALYALEKANVPTTDLVAIVDPSVEYTMNTLTNLSDVSNNPRWEGIVSSGIATGMRFIKNIYGFDVYTSQNLKSGITETIDSVAASGAVANMFFSASPDVVPFVGAIRQAPKVDSEYNKDLQRDEYVTTTRYGLKVYRPENVITVLSEAHIV